MATGEATATKTEILSLQSRIEQCEAAIQSAHTVLDAIEPRDDVGGAQPEVPGGAMAAIDRCNAQMPNLIGRLQAVAEKVGSL